MTARGAWRPAAAAAAMFLSGYLVLAAFILVPFIVTAIAGSPTGPRYALGIDVEPVLGSRQSIINTLTLTGHTFFGPALKPEPTALPGWRLAALLPAALLVLEAVGRCVPGVLANEASAVEESFSDGLLEYPQYTRPARFRGWEVPEVLRSGDHARVARWRRAQSLARTIERRPDLIEARGGLSDEDRQLLAAHGPCADTSFLQSALAGCNPSSAASALLRSHFVPAISTCRL